MYGMIVNMTITCFSTSIPSRSSSAAGASSASSAIRSLDFNWQQLIGRLVANRFGNSFVMWRGFTKISMLVAEKKVLKSRKFSWVWQFVVADLPQIECFASIRLSCGCILECNYSVDIKVTQHAEGGHIVALSRADLTTWKGDIDVFCLVLLFWVNSCRRLVIYYLRGHVRSQRMVIPSDMLLRWHGMW